jgi:hypothetical protein
MGVPIPGGVGVFEDEAESSSEEESEEESETEELPFRRVPDAAVAPRVKSRTGSLREFIESRADDPSNNRSINMACKVYTASGAQGQAEYAAYKASCASETSNEESLPRLPVVPVPVPVPRLTSTNETSPPTISLYGQFIRSVAAANGELGGNETSKKRAIKTTLDRVIASGQAGNDAFDAFMASRANERSKTPTAALVANGGISLYGGTNSSKKQKTGAQEKGLDNRPAWVVRMEREKLFSSSSFDKADTQRSPSMHWGKPQCTASRLAPTMSWGKPQSTVSRSAPSMSWGQPQSTDPAESTSCKTITFVNR